MNIQSSKKQCIDQLADLRNEFNEFSYIVSHDLKAPVRAISNLSTWIEEDLGEAVPADVQQNMNLLRSRTSRLELMIDALLKYSRVSLNQLNLDETNVQDIIDTAHQSIAGIQPVHLTVPVPLPVFHTYKEQLSFILTEILHNTAYFGKNEKLTLTVTTREHHDHVQFELADNGGGVPEDALDKLFRLFYTVAPKDVVETTGAGLTIIKKMVQVAGGEVEAMNNDTGGLTIRFSWPKEMNNQL